MLQYTIDRVQPSNFKVTKYKDGEREDLVVLDCEKVSAYCLELEKAGYKRAYNSDMCWKKKDQVSMDHKDILKNICEDSAERANEARLALDESNLPIHITEYLKELCNAEIKRNWQTYMDLDR